MNLYLSLNFDGTLPHGGKGIWSLPMAGAPGRWMPRINSRGQRVRGYQLYREQDLIFWLGPVLYTVEIRGRFIIAENKIIASEGRLIRPVDIWTPTAAVQFAVDCAARVLKFYEAAFPDDLRPRQALEAARSGACDVTVCGTVAEAAEAARAYAASVVEAKVDCLDTKALSNSDVEAVTPVGDCAEAILISSTKAERASRALRAQRAARSATLEAVRAISAAAEAAWALGQVKAPGGDEWANRAVQATVRAAANAAEAGAAASAATRSVALKSRASEASPENTERQWQNRHLLEMLGLCQNQLATAGKTAQTSAMARRRSATNAAAPQT